MSAVRDWVTRHPPAQSAVASTPIREGLTIPYITEENRIALLHRKATAPGELAYLLWVDIGEYMEQGDTYARFAEVLGVLESLKLEFNRRFVAPYEDKKRKLNGDVW